MHQILVGMMKTLNTIGRSLPRPTVMEWRPQLMRANPIREIWRSRHRRASPEDPNLLRNLGARTQDCQNVSSDKLMTRTINSSRLVPILSKMLRLKTKAIQGPTKIKPLKCWRSCGMTNNQNSCTCQSLRTTTTTSIRAAWALATRLWTKRWLILWIILLILLPRPGEKFTTRRNSALRSWGLRTKRRMRARTALLKLMRKMTIRVTIRRSARRSWVPRIRFTLWVSSNMSLVTFMRGNSWMVSALGRARWSLQMATSILESGTTIKCVIATAFINSKMETSM